MSAVSHFKFDISPEKEASFGQYLWRQLFVTAPEVSRSDADLAGKTAIVTGANVGIGFECARQLLDLGLTKLIMGVRDESKGEAARQKLLAGRPLSPDAVEVWSLDLASYTSIAAFAERARQLPQLNIAVLNAGVYRADESFNPATGFEEDVQVNYLSTALLTLLLLPVARAAKPGRISIVSSDMAAWARFPERSADPVLAAFKSPAAKWDMAERYGTSKLLGQMFVAELARHRLDPEEAIVNLVNPGFCYGSELGRDGKGRLMGVVYRILFRLLGHTTEVGARSLVAAAVKFGPEVHGQYVEDGRIRPSAPILYTPEGESLAKKMWEEIMEEFSDLGVQLEDKKQ